ncbi:MAG: hypothetical protein IKU52_05305 [Clostridia bacterium]|nr:hypothetical protein [Clostridia bacterium]
MKKILNKRILAFSLVFLMIFSYLPMLSVSVSAKDTASVGGVGYQTLEEAVASAPNGSTVYLNSDTEIDKTLTITKSLTIASKDGDYTISRKSGFSGSFFDVSGSLLLTGKTGALTLDGSNTGAKAALICVSGGALTVNSGVTLTGNSNAGTNGSGVYIDSGVFNFNGGYIGENISAGYGNAVYVANDFGTFRMSGGARFGAASTVYLKASSYMEIPADLTGSSDIKLCLDNVYDGRKAAEITGSFILSSDQTDRIKVYNGSELCETVYSGSGIFVSFETDEKTEDVCKIGDKIYDTLAEAVAAAKAGETTQITLLSGFSLPSTVKISGSKDIVITASKSCTVSRASSFKDKAMFTVDAKSSLTVKGSVQINGAGISASNAVSLEGSLTLGKGAAFTNHNCENGVIYVKGGSFTMDGGMLSGNTVNCGTVYIHNGSFVMNNGEIKNNTAVNGGGVYLVSGNFDMLGGRIYDNTATLGSCVWTDVDFYLAGSAALGSETESPMVYLGTGAAINVAKGWFPEALSINSGVITLELKDRKFNTVAVEFEDEAKTDNFCLALSMGTQFALKADGKNLILVSSDGTQVAFYDNKGYTSVEEAFSNIPENASGTVTVTADALFSATVTVKKGQNIILIAGDGLDSETAYTQRTLKREAEFTGPFFNIEKDASLAICAPEGKKLCIDGESKEVNSPAVITAGVFSIGLGGTIVNNINKKGETLTANGTLTQGGAVFVSEKGVCTVSKGSVENCYASKGGAIYVRDGLLNLSEGSFVKNSALMGGAIYLETSTPFEKQKESEEGYIYAAFNMTEGIIKENTASAVQAVKYSGEGGGIFAGNGTKTIISGGSISSNKAERGSAAAIGNIPAKVDDKVDAPEFSLTKKIIIEEDNNIYLALPGISCIQIIEALDEQKKPIEISIPETLPQHMPLVRFVAEKNEEEDNKKKEEEEEKVISAKPALEKELIKLEKTAAEKYILSISDQDESLIINTTEDGVFNGYKTGRHYNPILRYKEETVKDEEKEQPEKEKAEDEKTEEKEEKKNQIKYKPITVSPNGIFSSYYEMNYYTDGYKSIETMITAPFAKGTKITLIDSTDQENIGYYYYKVTGEEKVAIKGEATDIKNEEGVILTALDTLEIPLRSFLKMGSETEHYKMQYKAEEKQITEKVTFVVDFTQVEIEESRTPVGEFMMVWNHYVEDSKTGMTYDISAFIGHSIYTVKDEKESEIILTVSEDGAINVSYSVSAESDVLCEKYGVILLSLGTRYPKGTVLEDENGNQYIAPERSSLLCVPMPKDSKGNLIKKGDMTFTVKNYYGAALTESSMRAYIYASANGKHYSDYADYDARSEAVTVSVSAKEKTGILVTNPGKEERPFYNGYEELEKSPNIEFDVKCVVDGEETDKFRLFLRKKQKDGTYENCELSELFVIEDKTITTVELTSGRVNLALRQDLESILGSEFKIGFKNEDSVEYVKVNVTE